MTVLHSFLVATFVATTVLPALHALSILQVILPVALILRAIYVNVNTVSVGLIVFPLAFIYVAIGMPELSTAVSLVLAPLTLILSVIGPYLDTRSVSHIILKVAFVNSSIFEGKFLDKLEALLDSLLLKIDKILVFSVEQMWHLPICLRRILLLLLIWNSLSVVLGESAVSVVVALLLPVVVHFVLDFDLPIFFSGIDASTSVTHFFEN
jgi:hypothetical protein